MTSAHREYAEQLRTLVAFNYLVGGAGLQAALHRLLFGPRRQGWSWLYECLTGVMAAAIRAGLTASAPEIRRSLGRISRLPLAADAVVEPTTLGGVAAEWVRTPDCREDAVLLYLHGGGYISGSPATHRVLIAELSRCTHLPALAVDYRLAPEDPFPAALVDAWRVYWQLLAMGREPAKIVVAGDSAGGGLAVALMTALRDAGLPLPAAVICLSPWTDLTLNGKTLAENHAYDYLDLPVMQRVIPLILNGAAPQDPLVSPIYADLHGLPPLLIQVGTAEMLYDDAAALAHRASQAGVPVQFEPWANMVHVWHFVFAFEPTARDAVASIGRFVRSHLPEE